MNNTFRGAVDRVEMELPLRSERGPNRASSPAPAPVPPSGAGRVGLAGLGLAAVNLLRLFGFVAVAVSFFLLWFFNPVAGRSILVGVPIAVLLFFTRLRRDFLIWAVYVVGFLVFIDLRMISAEVFFPARFDYVITLEKTLFLGAIPSVWLQQHLYAMGSPTLLDLALIGVHFSFFLVPHLLVSLLWYVDPQAFRRYAVALVATCYFGLGFAFLVPTAPPWLAGTEGRIEPVFRVLRDVMMGLTPETYGVAYRAVGENAVAAMPSLHAALTALVALGASSAFPRFRIVGWAYFAAMAFALVYLGEHYVVDIVAGVMAGWAFWHLAGRCFRVEPSQLLPRRNSYLYGSCLDLWAGLTNYRTHFPGSLAAGSRVRVRRISIDLSVAPRLLLPILIHQE